MVTAVGRPRAVVRLESEVRVGRRRGEVVRGRPAARAPARRGAPGVRRGPGGGRPCRGSSLGGDGKTGPSGAPGTRGSEGTRTAGTPPRGVRAVTSRAGHSPYHYEPPRRRVRVIPGSPRLFNWWGEGGRSSRLDVRGVWSEGRRPIDCQSIQKDVFRLRGMKPDTLGFPSADPTASTSSSALPSLAHPGTTDVHRGCTRPPSESRTGVSAGVRDVESWLGARHVHDPTRGNGRLPSH